MGRDASLRIAFADDDYTFRLPWGRLVELQEAADAGPWTILQRLLDGSWRVQDISSVIRLGLIGGGLSPAWALSLTRTYVEERPPLETLPLAQAILATALQGGRDEPPGEAVGEATGSGSTTSPTESSAPPSSTAGSPRSGASRTKRTGSASGKSSPRSTATRKRKAPARAS